MNIFGFENYINKGLGGLNPKLDWEWKPAYWDLIKNPKSLLSFNSKIEIYMPNSPQRGKSQRAFTLLLSRKNPMIGHIMLEMRKQKKPFVYINWDEFIEEGIVYFDESQNSYQLRYKKDIFNLKNAKSIYYDYFEILEVFHYKRSKFTNKEKVFLARWIESLKTLEFICQKSKWFPSTPTQIDFEVQNKFGELLHAKGLGFEIPKMIYSNEPREVRKFLKKYTGILKESGLKSFSSNEKPGSKQLIFDSKIISPQDKNLEKIQNTPCMFQEFIEKEYDLRITGIENKILSAKIESQKNKKSKSDWRGQEHLIPFKPYKLPKTMERKILKFMKDYKFKVASFDLVRSQSGKYYFLEMNRPGQWFFIEALSGIPITKTLVSKF